MDISNKYCIYVGTSRGAIQNTFCKQDEKASYAISENPSEITSMEWGRAENEILIGHKSGEITVYDTDSNKFKKTIKEMEGSGAVVGIGCLNNTTVIGKHDGIVNILNQKLKLSNFFSLDLDEKGSLDCLVYNKNRENVVGTGGAFNDFKLWDIEKQLCIFKAKSMGHDELNLPIPTSIRGITYLPENEHLSACATKEGYVLLYDDRSQRRPVVKFLETKASYTCISSAYREKECLVGTTRGYMQLLDMKNPSKCLKTFTNYVGSVTSIVCDAHEPYIASTSLDRHLRIHNLETKQLVYKTYLKQSLTRILMSPVIKEEENVEENEQKMNEEINSEDEEYEEIFNNMEVVTEKKRKSSVDNKTVITSSKKKRKKRIH